MSNSSSSLQSEPDYFLDSQPNDDDFESIPFCSSEVEVVPETEFAPPLSESVPYFESEFEVVPETFIAPPFSESLPFSESVVVEVVPETEFSPPPSDSLAPFQTPSMAVDSFLPPVGSKGIQLPTPAPASYDDCGFVSDSPQESDLPTGERSLDYWEATMVPTDPYYWLMTQCAEHRRKRKALAAASAVIRTRDRKRKPSS